MPLKKAVKSVTWKKSCKRCAGVSASTGKRCKNMIACEKGAHAYCHVHSGAYKKAHKKVSKK